MAKKTAPKADKKHLKLVTAEEPTTTAVAEPVAEETPAATAKVEKEAKETKHKKLSALNAAAQVLAASGQPMNCKELIEEMTKQKLWSSPNGLTPEATLYASLLREIKTKGDNARFSRLERGKFAAK